MICASRTSSTGAKLEHFFNARRESAVQLHVREMRLEETSLVIDYFHSSTPEHLEMLGVDPTRLLPKEVWASLFKSQYGLPLLGAPPWCSTVIFRRFEKRLFLKDFFATENRWRRGRDSHPSYRIGRYHHIYRKHRWVVDQASIRISSSTQKTPIVPTSRLSPS